MEYFIAEGLPYYLICRYDQGILDVGLTEEDHVELVKTYTYVRKHPTGSAKIELHVLQVKTLNLDNIFRFNV